MCVKHVYKMCINKNTLSNKGVSLNLYLKCAMIVLHMTQAKSQTKKGKRRKRQKAHGFLSRTRTSGGRNIIKRRRLKGRKKLSA